MKRFYILLCILAIACRAEATTNRLSVSMAGPSTLRFSWPSNSAVWRLNSASDLSVLVPTWQTITNVPSFSNNTFSLLVPATNKSGYYRLIQTADTCVLRATPSLITSGQSSLLTWCTVPGTTYRLTPGPGSVSGGSFTVSPTVTTVYTLTASNTTGIVTNSCAIVVGPCGYGSVSNMVGTMRMEYEIKKAAGPYEFDIYHFGDLTFKLQRSGGADNAPLFTGTLGGEGNLADTEYDSTSGQLYVTQYYVIGQGPAPDLSAVTLGIDCTSGTYTLSVVSSVSGTEFDYTPAGDFSFPQTFGFGQLVIVQHPLPLDSAILTFDGPIVKRSPTWFGGGDYFEIGDGVDNDLYFNGLSDDSNSGTAQITWSFTPAP